MKSFIFPSSMSLTKVGDLPALIKAAKSRSVSLCPVHSSMKTAAIALISPF